MFGKAYDLFAVELKQPGSRCPGPYTDLVKLGKEMKLMLDALVLAGVRDPVVCGLLIKGIS